MSAFLGPRGGLVEFKCPSAESVQFAERSSFRSTLGGRVVEQRGPRPRRVWSVSVDAATPDQIAGLESLYLLNPSGDWWFLPPDALSVNMLTPAESLLMPGTYQPAASEGGPSIADDGFRIPSTVLVPASTSAYLGIGDSASVRRGVPVIAGRTYTASVYGNGSGGTVSMVFRNSSDVTISTVNSEPMTSARARRSVTAVAPVGAVEVLLRFNSASTAVRFGAPALTAGAGLTGWGVGRGCRSSSVDGLSAAVTHAVQGIAGLNLADYSFTVQEVG